MCRINCLSWNISAKTHLKKNCAHFPWVVFLYFLCLCVTCLMPLNVPIVNLKAFRLSLGNIDVREVIDSRTKSQHACFCFLVIWREAEGTIMPVVHFCPGKICRSFPVRTRFMMICGSLFFSRLGRMITSNLTCNPELNFGCAEDPTCCGNMSFVDPWTWLADYWCRKTEKIDISKRSCLTWQLWKFQEGGTTR